MVAVVSSPLTNSHYLATGIWLNWSSEKETYRRNKAPITIVCTEMSWVLVSAELVLASWCPARIWRARVLRDCYQLHAWWPKIWGDQHLIVLIVKLRLAGVYLIIEFVRIVRSKAQQVRERLGLMLLSDKWGIGWKSGILSLETSERWKANLKGHQIIMSCDTQARGLS